MTSTLWEEVRPVRTASQRYMLRIATCIRCRKWASEYKKERRQHRRELAE